MEDQNPVNYWILKPSSTTTATINLVSVHFRFEMCCQNASKTQWLQSNPLSCSPASASWWMFNGFALKEHYVWSCPLFIHMWVWVYTHTHKYTHTHTHKHIRTYMHIWKCAYISILALISVDLKQRMIFFSVKKSKFRLAGIAYHGKSEHRK